MCNIGKSVHVNIHIYIGDIALSNRMPADSKEDRNRSRDINVGLENRPRRNRASLGNTNKSDHC